MPDQSLPCKDVARWLEEADYRAAFLAHICRMTKFRHPPRWALQSDPIDTHRLISHYFGIDFSPQICAAQYLTTALSRTWPDATVIRDYLNRSDTDHSSLIQQSLDDFNPVLGQVIFGASTTSNCPNFFKGLKSRLQPIDWLPDRPTPDSPPPPPPPNDDGKGRFSFLLPKSPKPAPNLQEPPKDASPETQRTP